MYIHIEWVLLGDSHVYIYCVYVYAYTKATVHMYMPKAAYVYTCSTIYPKQLEKPLRIYMYITDIDSGWWLIVVLVAAALN